MLLFWIFVFVVSLILLVKGADWLIESSEKIGLVLGLSPFIVGVLIVGAGTSLPELMSSLVATVKGVNDVAVANVVGSNIANILLIVGISAVTAKKLVVTKNLIDIDSPLLILGTVLLGISMWDGKITLGEAIILIVSYVIYLFYTVIHKEEGEEKNILNEDKKFGKKILVRDVVLLIIGIGCLVLGSNYLIEALINLSTMLNVATGIITVTAVAVGTSLPELVVSVKAAFQKKSDVALGNIFGSNIFNALVVVGVPGLFGTLVVDEKTLSIGLPVMALATLIFVISGISKKIYIWEGLFYLAIYFLFIIKLFNWF